MVITLGNNSASNAELSFKMKSYAKVIVVEISPCYSPNLTTIDVVKIKFVNETLCLLKFTRGSNLKNHFHTPLSPGSDLRDI